VIRRHRSPPATTLRNTDPGLRSLRATSRDVLADAASGDIDRRLSSLRAPLWRVHTAVTAALAAACAIALACAGAAPARSSLPASPAGASREQPLPGDPRAEITELDRQITAELTRAEVTAPPVASCSGDTCTSALAAPFATPTAEDPACHPAPSDHCSDICKLSTSICHNQDRICELARSLPGDDWAANKCTSARTSCQTAHQRCCGCTG